MSVTELGLKIIKEAETKSLNELGEDVRHVLVQSGTVTLGSGVVILKDNVLFQVLDFKLNNPVWLGDTTVYPLGKMDIIKVKHFYQLNKIDGAYGFMNCLYPLEGRSYVGENQAYQSFYLVDNIRGITFFVEEFRFSRNPYGDRIIMDNGNTLIYHPKGGEKGIISKEKGIFLPTDGTSQIHDYVKLVADWSSVRQTPNKKGKVK